MRRGLLTVLFCLNVVVAFCQTVGDYRTYSTGNWNSARTWLVYYNGAWRNIYSSGAGPYQNIIPSNTSGTITIVHNVIVNGPISVNQLVVQNGTLTSNYPITLVNDAALSLVVAAGAVLQNNSTLNLQGVTSQPCQINGTLNNASVIQITNPAMLLFNNGSAYTHTHATAGSIPLATWNANSTCSITGMSTNNPSPPLNLNQSFGHFIWNTPGMGATTTFSFGSNPLAVAGNLTFVATNGREVRLKNGAAGYNLNVGGNFDIQGTSSVTLTQSNTTNTSVTIGGSLNISGGTLSLGNTNNSAIDVFITGDFNKTAGTITRGTGTGIGTIHFAGAAQTYTNNSAITTAINFIVQNGSNLNLGTTPLTGTGTFSALAGSTIQLGSTDILGAIQTGTTAGNIRVAGARIFQPGSTIVFNGTASQYLGPAHPSASNIILNNPNWLFIRQDQTISGSITLTLGAFCIGPHVLDIAGNFSHNGNNGMLGIISSSSLVISGAGTFDDLAFARYDVGVPNNPMNMLTINRPGATILQSDPDLTVAGVFTQAAGNYSFTTGGTRVLRLNSSIDQTAGASMIGTPNASIIIGGTGTIQMPSLNIEGALDTLTMNRASQTLFNGGPLTVSNLNLLNGTVDPSGLVTMASGGIVTRELGTLSAELAAQTSYSVIYGNAFNVLTGPEIPVSATALDNLTLNNQFNVTSPQGSPPYTVTLTSPIEINGAFTITEGTFNTGNNDIIIGEDFTISTNGVFQPGVSVVTFDGVVPQVVSTVAALSLNDVTLNQTPASTLTLASGTTLGITNSIMFTSASTINAGTNQLTLRSSATGTAYVGPIPTGGGISGSVIVQRHLPNATNIRAYRYLATPIVGAVVSDWQAEIPITGTFSNPSTGPGIVSNSPSMFRYDETFVAGGASQEARYRAYPASGSSTAAAINNGEGYAVYVRTAGQIVFDTRGTVRVGNVTRNVTNSGGANGGWNLLGNPYPSPIDWDNVAPDVTGGVGNAIYFTDNTNNGGGGGTVSYVNGVGVPGGYDGTIVQGQAFWVRTTSAGTVNFQESDKQPGQGQFFRKGDIMNLLRVTMQGQGLKDEIALRLHEEATDVFDNKYDAVKFNASVFSLASLSTSNEKLVINTVSSLACGQTIPLVIEGAQTGSFTLDFSGMETFDASVDLSLRDKVENKMVGIASTPQYAFTVTNLEALKTRFEIVVGRPAVETALTVKGEQVCESNSTAIITIQNSQQNVKYTAQWNGVPLAGEGVGNGGTVEFPLTVDHLPQGDQEITISAQIASCESLPLLSKATISVLKKGLISSVENGSVCGSGNVVIKATSLDAKSFNWYEDIGSTNPIPDQNTSEFTTPVLVKSKSYYVSAVNGLGCEGERVEVKAVVSNVEPVVIEADGLVLTSNYATGNQWYLDGVLIPGATGKQVEALASGVYTVTVTSTEGCHITSAGREMVVTGLEENWTAGGSVQIFPNPTSDKVMVEIKSKNTLVQAKLLSPRGVELNALYLKGEGSVKSGEFTLQSFPDGVYLLRIQDGAKVITKRITKVK